MLKGLIEDISTNKNTHLIHCIKPSNMAKPWIYENIRTKVIQIKISYECSRVGASLKLNAVQKRDNDSSSSDSNANVVSLPFVL